MSRSNSRLATGLRLALCVALGTFYLASFGFFISRSEDFILRGRFERSAPQALPLSLDFSQVDSRVTLAASGMSAPESWGTWTDGEKVEFKVKTSPPASAEQLLLRLHLYRAVVNSKNPEIEVDISVDREKAASLSVTRDEPQIIEAVFPVNHASHAYVIRLDLDGAISPKELGHGEDSRQLALGISRFEIVPVVGPSTP